MTLCRAIIIASIFTATAAIAGPSLFLPQVLGHCQIPCGIFDDPARIATMRENAASIRKADQQLLALHGIGTLESFNQSVRWTMEKERSAENIQHIAAAYFLAQRVKPAAANSPEHALYLEQLEGFHAVLVAAMKCKQQVKPTSVDVLDAAIERVAAWY